MSNLQSNRSLEAWVKANKGKLSGGTTDQRHIMKWTLTDPADLVVKLWNQVGTVTNNYDVDWGDGSEDTGVTTSDKTHTYASTGTYEVKITGQFCGLKMTRGSTADKNKLTEFSNWGTTEINGVRNMFAQCNNMTYTATDAPDLTNLTATNGTELRQMFQLCKSIVSLDLSSWDISNCSGSASMMFQDNILLESLNLTGWDTSNITSFNTTFTRCGNPTTGCVFTLPSLNLSSCTDLYGAFNDAKIDTINVSNWVLNASGFSMQNMFYGADAKSGGTWTLDLSTWTNTSGATKWQNLFRSCRDLTHINFTNFDTSNVTTMYLAFYDCPKLTHITGLSGWDASSLTGTAVQLLFYNCAVLDFNQGATTNFGANWGPNLGNCTNFSGFFTLVGNTTECTGPPEVGNWDMSGATTIYQMFYYLKTQGVVDVEDWDISSTTDIRQAFYHYKGTSPNLTKWEVPSAIVSMERFFRNALNTTTVNFADTSSDFSNVTTWQEFGYYSGLTNLQFPSNMSFAATVNMSSFLTLCTLATTDYDALLTTLESTWVDPGGFSGTLTAGFSKYTGGGAVATARANLVAAGWTISDGGTA